MIRSSARAFVALTTVAVALVAAEAICRVVDGYALSALTLVQTRAARPRVDTDLRSRALRYAEQVPAGPHVDRAWLTDDPPAIPPHPSPDWARARLDAYGGSGNALFEFNRAFLADRLCRDLATSVFGTMNDFLYFDPVEPGIYPSYRHPRRLSAPGWFTTNSFGWRGPDVSLDRPRNSIRIAFVGASTTVNDYAFPFSYPEFVGHWLNRWAAARGWPYSFEVINAGRTGIDSHSIAAIVRQELVPVDPDLVIYYEGSNQFWPPGAIGYRLGRVYPRPITSMRPTGGVERVSALGRRTVGAVRAWRGGDGREPIKPYQWIRLNGVNERDPDPYDPALPIELPAIVADLESIRAALEAIDSELVVTSFIWMVHDGMRLELPRQIGLFSYLNADYWPATYSTMRRLADLQNRVLAAYARENALPFLDVAGAFPLDSNLFADAIHVRDPAIRLHAWIVFQELTAVLDRRIAEGRLPRPPAAHRPVHPAFDQPSPRTVTRRAILDSCGGSPAQ